jgi:rhodanese-related sulfurtransferase
MQTVSGLDMRMALRQSGGLLLMAALCGLAWTALTGTGLFTRPSPGSAGPDAAIPHITYDEALMYLRQGDAIFIDARHGFDFHRGHIPGAINIPLADFESLQPVVATLPRDATIITYCDGQECNSSEALARDLMQQGFQHVKVFFAGWNQWVHESPNNSR